MKQMTRLFTVLTVVAFVLTFGVQVAAAMEIGVVDMQRVLANFNKVKQINDKLAAEKERRQEKLDKKQEELRDLKEKLDKEGEKLSKSDLQKRIGDLEGKLKDLHEYHDKLMGELRDQQAGQYQNLEKEIVKAVEQVARAMKLDVVLEKGVVFTGGKDVTGDVLKRLNGK